MTIDRPNEPGGWARDSHPYLVYLDCGTDNLIYTTITTLGRSRHGCVSGLPLGNWQKLGVTAGEARERFRRWLDGEVEFDEGPELIGEIADKAAELFAGVQEREQEPGVDQLYRHAIKCVDRVFQECKENPKPILPDFLGLGADKFEGVVKLAEKYRAVSDKIAAVTTKLEKYKRVLIENQDFCGAAAVKDCLQLLNGFEPKLLSEVEDQIAGLKSELKDALHARDALQQTIVRLEGEIAKYRDKFNEVVSCYDRYGDSPVTRGYPGLAKMIDRLRSEIRELRERLGSYRIASQAPQPEVIEGRGQAVTEEGWYWYADDSGNYCACYKTKDNTFANGGRYQSIPRPTFPPKPAFVAPEKPELTQSLIRLSGGECVWVVPVKWAGKEGVLHKDTMRYWWTKDYEVISETTGEVLK